MKIKNSVLFAIVLTALISFINIVCYASTSSALSETTLISTMVSQFGTDYLAPFTPGDDEVNLSEGTTDIKEIDLSLPGKNGFDLNIYRVFNSNRTRGGYKYATNAQRVHTDPMYLYNYKLNGVSKSCYVAFDKEEEMVDSFKANASALSRPAKDLSGTEYFKHHLISSNTGTILFTRDITQGVKFMSESSSVSYDLISYFRDVEIGNGFNIPMPQIKKTDSYYVNDYTQRVYQTFRTESGEIVDFWYSVYQPDSQSPWKVDNEEISNRNGYVINIYAENQNHELGFEYNISAKNNSGKTYYFCVTDITKGGAGLPVGVTDKYNNVIYYTENDDSSVEITDTMGREIVVSPSGITVVKGGNSQSVIYEKSYIPDSRDPNNLLNCINTNILTVCKNQGNTQEKLCIIQKIKRCILPKTDRMSIIRS